MSDLKNTRTGHGISRNVVVVYGIMEHSIVSFYERFSFYCFYKDRNTFLHVLTDIYFVSCNFTRML